MQKIHSTEKILKLALVLDNQERKQYLDEVADSFILKSLSNLLNDDKELTDYVIKTLTDVDADYSTPIKDLQAGDRIHQFIIKRLIAKGGMGSVYLAYDEKLQRNIALKTIRPEYLHDEKNQQRFKREALILSQINHPSICQIFDSIDYDNGNLLILEYIEGKTLNECQLNDKQQLDVFIQIASALKAAHVKSVVHRDLKPDNIMINDDNDIKILDFGIAKSKSKDFEANQSNPKQKDGQYPDDLTQMNSMMGTLLYMSPEQADQEPIKQSSDIYTFAIIIQQVLTKCGAYNYSDTDELKKQVTSANIVNQNSVPKEFQNLLKSMTRLNPKNRPSAEKILKQLLFIKDRKEKKAELLKKMVLVSIIVVVTSFLIWQYFTNKNNEQKDIFITNVTNKIEIIKSDIQNIYSLPIHNVTGEIEQLETRALEEINLINSSKHLSQPEKNHLIGKAYIVIGDHEKAVEFLEKSWQQGNKTAMVATSLSNSYSKMFFEKINLHSKTYGLAKPNKFNDTEEYFLNKINKYIPLSQNKTSNLTNALLLRSEEKNIQAIELLDSAIRSKDWMFEAYSLKAHILNSQARSNRNDGHEEKATELLIQALKTYQDAKSRGRSYAEAYKGLCGTHFEIISDAVHRTNRNIDENFKLGLKACKDIIKINGNTNGVLGLLSKYNYYYASNQHQNGLPAKDYLKKALRWNKLALKDKLSYKNYNIKAEIYASIAQIKFEHGQNPLPDVNQSVAANIDAIKISGKTNGHLYSSMIYSLLFEIKYKIQHGIDTSSSLQKVEEFYQLGFNSLISNHTKKFLYLNMADALSLRARAEVLADINPQATVKKIEGIIKDEQKIADEPFGYNILASAYLQQAIFNQRNGLKALTDIKKALKNANKANALLQNNYTLKTTKANILRELELIQLKNNIHYKMDFTSAMNMYESSLKLNPNVADTYANFAKMYLFKTLNLFSKNSTNKGIAACKKTLNINPNHPFVLDTYATLITHGIKVGLISEQQRRKAISMSKKSHELNPLIKEYQEN